MLQISLYGRVVIYSEMLDLSTDCVRGVILINLHYTLGKFSRGQTDNIFLFFADNKLRYFM